MRKDLPVALFLFSPLANSFVLCQISEKHHVDSTDSWNTSHYIITNRQILKSNKYNPKAIKMREFPPYERIQKPYAMHGLLWRVAFQKIIQSK